MNTFTSLNLVILVLQHSINAPIFHIFECHTTALYGKIAKEIWEWLKNRVKFHTTVLSCTVLVWRTLVEKFLFHKTILLLLDNLTTPISSQTYNGSFLRTLNALHFYEPLSRFRRWETLLGWEGTGWCLVKHACIHLHCSCVAVKFPFTEYCVLSQSE